MTYMTFQKAFYLCKAEKARIDDLWKGDPSYDDYKLEVEVMDDTIHIYPSKNVTFLCASKFFAIASLLDTSIYVGTFHRNDGAIVPYICIF